MIEVKTDKGIPIPAKNTRNGLCKYPFGQMEIGDSFFSPQLKANYMNGYVQRLKPRKFTVRTMVEGGIKGIRVWRIA